MATLRPRRIALLSASMLVLIAATYTASRSPWKDQREVHRASPPTLDISKPEQRDAFLHYAMAQPGEWSSNLPRRCGKVSGVDDVYRVEAFHSFHHPPGRLVELRQSGSSATSLRYEYPFPPPPPPPGTTPVGWPPNRPVAREVSRETFENIAAAAEQLWRDGVPLAHSEDVLDGDGVWIEFCRAGQYGFYARHPIDSAGGGDLRVVGVANLILATADEEPIDVGFSVAPPK